MEAVVLLFFWLVLCFACASIGSGRKIGYWGAFFACLFLSPLIGSIIALNSTVIKPVIEYKCKHCGLIAKEYSHYCPRCLRDNDGFTVEENRERFIKKE